MASPLSPRRRIRTIQHTTDLIEVLQNPLDRNAVMQCLRVCLELDPDDTRYRVFTHRAHPVQCTCPPDQFLLVVSGRFTLSYQHIETLLLARVATIEWSVVGQALRMECCIPHNVTLRGPTTTGATMVSVHPEWGPSPVLRWHGVEPAARPCMEGIIDLMYSTSRWMPRIECRYSVHQTKYIIQFTGYQTLRWDSLALGVYRYRDMVQDVSVQLLDRSLGVQWVIPVVGDWSKIVTIPQ